MNNKIIAIHQPNFFPWLGFFNKINTVDEFIFFDNVQVSNGRNWFSRTKILLNGKEYWLTIPILRNVNSLKICDVKVSEPQRTWRKILGTTKQAYLKSNYFPEIFDFLNQINLAKYYFLAEFNVHFIIELTKKLKIDNKKFYKTSDSPELLKSNKLQSDMILEVCKHYNTNSYLSGNGCFDFFKPELLEQNGIKCSFQNYIPKQYKQIGVNNFIPGLSIIDSLMNIGFEGVKRIL